MGNKFKLILMASIITLFLCLEVPSATYYQIEGIAATDQQNRNESSLKPSAAYYTRSVNIPFLLQHQSGNPAATLGTVNTVAVGKHDLWFSATLIPNEFNKTYIDMICNGLLRNVSIGFIPITYTLDEDLFEVYTRIDLLEISAVVIPADPNAYISKVTKVPKTVLEVLIDMLTKPKGGSNEVVLKGA